MNEISIMIVDDHCLIREAFRSLLDHHKGFKVVAIAGSDENVIKMAQENRPDILLLDINMAPLGGFEIIKMLRKNSPLTKVIGLSVHSQPSYVKKMLRLGAKGYLTKNTPETEIIEGIVQVNGGHIFICNEVKNILTDQLLNDEGTESNINLLSNREVQIIGFLKHGQSSKQIAGELKISCKTVEVHRHHILKKLKLKNTISMISYLNSFAFDYSAVKLSASAI